MSIGFMGNLPKIVKKAQKWHFRMGFKPLKKVFDR